MYQIGDENSLYTYKLLKFPFTIDLKNFFFITSLDPPKINLLFN